ncbi:MAG: FAD-dependent thymidylate synthase, partial [Hyphomonadaceae bacterium]|nr:FAD-dependent thymidylate synthase [Clostridia bacterium]
ELTAVLMQAHVADFIAQGKDEKTANSLAEKKAIEDARYVLPNACETKMIVTMNVRSLINFFHHRLCERAQWEIRALALEMLLLVRQAAPLLFGKTGPRCVNGVCPEGKMSCGKTMEKRAFFGGLCP